MSATLAAGAEKPFGLFFAGPSDFRKLRRDVDDGMRPRTDFLAYLDDHGFQPVSLPSPEPFRGIQRWVRELCRPKSLLALRALTRSYRAILSLGEDVGMPLAVALSLFHRTMPVFVVCHGTYVNSRKFRVITALARRLPRLHVLAISESIRQQFIERLGFPAERCHLVGVPVDLDFYSRGAQLRNHPEPLIVSAGVVQRDYPTLFEAVEPLPVQVKVAVNSLWVKSYDVDAPHPENVELCEPELGTGLKELYGRASLVVVPLHQTDYACGYSTILEAMAMGKAVITTRTVGQTELVRDGENGYLVDPGDVLALREKIAELAADPEKADRLGAQGRELLEMKASLPVVTLHVTQLVQQLS